MQLNPIALLARALLVGVAAGAGALRTGRQALSHRATGQLGVFMSLIMGAVALVVVSITLFFGMSIAGDFQPQGDAFSATESISPDTSEYTYTVDRAPSKDDSVVRLDDTVTVVDTSTSTELTAGTDYEWNADTGELTLLSADTTGTYNVTYSGDSATYGAEARSTQDATGNAFSLFGTSVLVIPAAAVLAVLIGGLVGAVAYAGVGNIPGLNGGGQRRERR